VWCDHLDLHPRSPKPRHFDFPTARYATKFTPYYRWFHIGLRNSPLCTTKTQTQPPAVVHLKVKLQCPEAHLDPFHKQINYPTHPVRFTPPALTRTCRQLLDIAVSAVVAISGITTAASFTIVAHKFEAEINALSVDLNHKFSLLDARLSTLSVHLHDLSVYHQSLSEQQPLALRTMLSEARLNQSECDVTEQQVLENTGILNVLITNQMHLSHNQVQIAHLSLSTRRALYQTMLHHISPRGVGDPAYFYRYWIQQGALTLELITINLSTRRARDTYAGADLTDVRP